MDHSVIFSKVEVFADDGKSFCEFFMGGIPREHDDLKGIAEFDEYIDEEGQAQSYSVTASAYVYGENESEDADDDELAEIREKFENDDEWMSELTGMEDVGFSFDLEL
jgi:hypothetical protein